MSATAARTEPVTRFADGVFLVWGSPGQGPRSRAFAAALGIDVLFVDPAAGRGLRSALTKYPARFAKTLRLLRTRRPTVVFVQSPPTFAVMAVAASAWRRGIPFVVDAHSDAMTSPYWTKPRWLIRALHRAAAAVLVTNEHFAAELRAAGATPLVIRDVPQEPLGDLAASPADAGFSVMVVSTYAPDEPVEAVLGAAALLPDVTFHLTGDAARAARPLPAAPANVRFTGFLSDDDYRRLMAGAGAVACLTTHDHTMQRGACEALWAGRPIVTSDHALLRDYFDRGTEHVAATPEAIAAGVTRIAAGPAAYEQAIDDLQALRRREWDEALDALAAAIGPGAVPPNTKEASPWT
jgi:glycosyltransferase involved in cell wall biosynthesis